MNSLSPAAIADAAQRIAPYINTTPLLRSRLLNSWLGHDFLFKAEGFQKVGAFKTRGAVNALLTLKEQRALPDRIVAFSSGNHAQAVAYAAQLVGVEAMVVMPCEASLVKRRATIAYGAQVMVTGSRGEAEARAADLCEQGAYLLHPFDNDWVIAGQGTACYEVLRDGLQPDAVFASCGGGGWLSGTYLATQLLSPGTSIYGVEPQRANDAVKSCRAGRVIQLTEAPDTIADGARTLSVSARTLRYLRRLSNIYEVDEPDIVYWTQWLNHLLKTPVEPTSALAMAGAFDWARSQHTPQQVLVLLSGGNIAPETQRRIWAEDCLATTPERKAAQPTGVPVSTAPQA